MPRPTPLQILNRKNSNPWKIVGKKVWSQDHSQRSKADRMENREGEASVPSLFFILFLHITFFFHWFFQQFFQKKILHQNYSTRQLRRGNVDELLKLITLAILEAN
jgi:hypothetical protein